MIDILTIATAIILAVLVLAYWRQLLIVVWYVFKFVFAIAFFGGIGLLMQL
jgi:hypothetical protein